MGAKKPPKKKHINKHFTELSRDFLGILFMLFFSPMRNDPKRHISRLLPPTQSPGTIPPNVLCLCDFSFLVIAWVQNLCNRFVLPKTCCSSHLSLLIEGTDFSGKTARILFQKLARISRGFFSPFCLSQDIHAKAAPPQNLKFLC